MQVWQFRKSFVGSFALQWGMNSVLRKLSILILPITLVLSPLTARADDVTTPVKTVMDITKAIWEPGYSGEDNVFKDEYLNTIYSADFARSYREASKHPAYDPPEGETTGSPFDYDPIIGGQDGCSLEDIRVEDDGEGQVTALFKNHQCSPDDPKAAEDTVLIFHVKEEGGRHVVDDIYPVENGESGKSIKETLNEIAAQ